MDPVSKLRHAMTAFAGRETVIMIPGDVVTWGDLRAVLVRLEVVEIVYAPWCWEHACESAVCHGRHVTDAPPGVHCRSCDGHSCPEPWRSVTETTEEIHG